MDENKMSEKYLSEDILIMCDECRKKSGDGIFIKVRYTNTGGWSPKWEGRVCEHVTGEEALKYLKGDK